MTTRIYLDQEVKTAVLKNEKIDFFDNNRIYKFKGFHLQNQSGDLYLEINDQIFQDVPKLLELHVERVTLCETLRMPSYRECGIYENGSAQAELRVVDSTPMTYRMSMVGKKLEDIKNLLHLIKIGQIRPTMSYHDPQGGLSRVELEKELELAKAESAALCDALKNAESELVAKQKESDLTKFALARVQNQLNIEREKARLEEIHLKQVCVSRSNILEVVKILKAELEDRLLPFVLSKSMIGKLQTIIDFGHRYDTETKGAAETEVV